MGELDDLDAAGTGVADADIDDDGPDTTETDPDDVRGRPLATLDQAMDKLDLMDAFDELLGGGRGGLATGVEILGEGLVHSPYDDLLDAFEPVRDLADHTDLLDDLF